MPSGRGEMGLFVPLLLLLGVRGMGWSRWVGWRLARVLMGLRLLGGAGEGEGLGRRDIVFVSKRLGECLLCEVSGYREKRALGRRGTRRRASR